MPYDENSETYPLTREEQRRVVHLIKEHGFDAQDLAVARLARAIFDYAYWVGHGDGESWMADRIRDEDEG